MKNKAPKKSWHSDQLREAQQGQDQAAFDQAFQPFFQEEHPRVQFWLCQEYPNTDPEDIRDVVQDAMAIVYFSAWKGMVQDLDRLDAYLRSVARRQLNKRLKKNRVIHQELEEQMLVYEPFEAPENYLEIGKRLLRKLGEKCQRILLLWSQRVPMKDIADELDYSDDAVARKSKERCLKRLKKLREGDSQARVL